MAEVWLRQLPVETDALRHLLRCTLQQIEEEVIAQTSGFTDEQLWDRPFGISPAGFHIRHIAESIDRLMTYAEGRMLDDDQLAILKHELSDKLPLLSLIVLLEQRLKQARLRLDQLDVSDYSALRYIGRKRVEVPLGTLLGHIAEHSQRHLGQLVTTVKMVRTLTGEPGYPA